MEYILVHTLFRHCRKEKAQYRLKSVVLGT